MIVSEAVLAEIHSLRYGQHYSNQIDITITNNQSEDNDDHDDDDDDGMRK